MPSSGSLRRYSVRTPDEMTVTMNSLDSMDCLDSADGSLCVDSDP
jgi:hypothetical protein